MDTIKKTVPSGKSKSDPRPQAPVGHPREGKKKPKHLQNFLKKELQKANNPLAPPTELELNLHAPDGFDEMDVVPDSMPD